MQSEAKAVLGGIYGNQVSFINEWGLGTANLGQLSFDQEGEARYIVGWHETDQIAHPSARNINIEAGTKPSGYRGALC